MALVLFHPKQDEKKLSTKNEEIIKKVKFTVNKFNSRVKPSKKDRILIIGCFSEFGCETVGVVHCIPRLLKRFPGLYIIAIGWFGRSYLYKHLVDEFWEIDESCMHLRNRTFAFHYKSENLKQIEEQASKYGTVIPTNVLGKYAVGNICKTCGHFWSEWRKNTKNCSKCNSTNIINSLFSNAENYLKLAKPVPKPCKSKLDWAYQLTKRPCVGVFGRGRKTYGRNLEPSFYIKLIENLKSQGYNPIWLGEKESTLPCPVDDVLDFSRSNESRDLEKTLAIICNCDFTIQFWTASSRLSGLMGVPFLLFESPEQIYCSGLSPGQEGRRLELTTFGKKKLAIANFFESSKNPDQLLYYVDKAIKEMKENNYNDIITNLVADIEASYMLKNEYYNMIGSN